MGRPMGNAEIAATFARLADLLEIGGESAYRTSAYRRAAETLAAHPEPIAAIAGRGELLKLPNVGKAIADKIGDLLETGTFPLLEETERLYPAGVADLLTVPDIGPKRARALFESLGIDGLPALREAVAGDRLAAALGIGAGAAKRIAEGLGSMATGDQRLPLGVVREIGAALIARLRDVAPPIEAIELAGSARRMRETVGDLDLVAAATDTEGVVAAFAALADVERVELRGPNRCRALLDSGLPADLWVLPPPHFATLLFHITGDQHHDTRMRELARERGAKLSEYGLTSEGETTTFPDEAAIYRAFDMDPIPATMREGRDAIVLARDHRLPATVEAGDIRGDLHVHSRWSDGKRTVREMADAAHALGYSYLCITDHSQGLGVANGLGPERLAEQRREIDAVNAEVAPFRVLQGCEVEVRGDGSLDLPDEVLATLDWVTASVHSNLRTGRERVTARALAAIEHPLVDVLAHPTGRIVGGRAGGDFDMEALFAAAATTGTALEINADPARLDLRDTHAAAAVAAGCSLTIGSDAHDTPGLTNARVYGVAVAQRAWVPADRILTTMPVDDLLARRKRSRA